MSENTFTQEELQLTKHAMKIAREKGADKFRITLNRSTMDQIGTLDGEVDKVTHSLDRSMSLCLFVDGRFGTFSTNRLEAEAMESFIEKAVATTRLLAPDPCRVLPDQSRVEKGATTGLELDLYDPVYEEMTAEKRLETALSASLYKTLPEGSMLSEEAEYCDCLFDSLILDSNGTRCRHIETSFEYSVEVTLADESGRRYSAFWWDAAPKRSEMHPEVCCSKAIELAKAQFNPKPRRSGSYNMVLDNACSSRVLSPIMKALNTYSLQQQNSFLVDSLGKQMFHEGMTVMDECRSTGFTGTRLFDSEGVATKVMPIIENGVVKTYFTNSYMAAKTGMEPTIDDAVRPHLMPWPKAGMDRDALMKECRNGILVTRFNGGNSNSATGDYSFGVEGFAFKDGKITHPVREMLITGNLIELWKHLKAIGDDARPCTTRLIPSIAFTDVDFSG